MGNERQFQRRLWNPCPKMRRRVWTPRADCWLNFQTPISGSPLMQVMSITKEQNKRSWALWRFVAVGCLAWKSDGLSRDYGKVTASDVSELNDCSANYSTWALWRLVDVCTAASGSGLPLRTAPVSRHFCKRGFQRDVVGKPRRNVQRNQFFDHKQQPNDVKRRRSTFEPQQLRGTQKCIYQCIYTYIRIFVYVDIYIYICVYIYIYIYIYRNFYIFGFIGFYIYRFFYYYTHIYIYIYIDIYIYILFRYCIYGI
jgi:hypothetical protein